MKIHRLRNISVSIIIFCIAIIPVMAYSLSTEHSTSSSKNSGESTLTTTTTTKDLESPLSITYSPDGKGYLKEIAPQKSLLHVEGSPYEMGYQHGYLCPEEVSRMASPEYYMGLVFDLIGFDEDSFINSIIDVESIVEIFEDFIDPEIIIQVFEEVDNWLIELFIETMLKICESNICYIPHDLLMEMQGIADGATDAGFETSFENVLIINMGMDALFSVVHPILPILMGIFDSINIHMCNGFVATGEATIGDSTIMGRYFMYPSGVFYEVALLIEQYPDVGNAFVSTTAPGFVGVTAAMNSKGIGIGMQVCSAMDCTPGKTGMGALLTARTVVQYADELSDAVNLIKNSERGVSWIYIIGDGRGSETGGVVLEVSAHYWFPRYTNYVKPNYVPEIYPQIENEEGLIVATNHFIRTEMNVLSLSHAASEDSIERYEYIVEDTQNSSGDINFEIGRELIGALAPQSHSPVRASISCWDLTNLETKALFGYYDDEWVHHELTIE